MDDLAKDYPEEAWLREGGGKTDFRAEKWHDFYWQAWHSLRYDRPYIGMSGAEMPIYYSAISRYAQDNGIVGESRDRLLRFVAAIDDAYLENQRKAAEKSKSEQA